MKRPTPLRRLLTVLAAVLLASTGVVLTAQSALADGGQKVVRVQDRCDQPTWDQDPFHELNGLCNPDGGDVTPARFRADLPRGGNGHWRFNNRHGNVNRGDGLVILRQGGGLHTLNHINRNGYTPSS